MLSIAISAKISLLADIEESVKGTDIIIEDDVVIDSFVKIKPAGGSGTLRIGLGSHINSGTVIYTGNGVKIGKGCLIAANCTFAPVNHQFVKADTFIKDQGFLPSKGGIIVEDDVWIGANCVILDGAYLAKGCVVAAHSLVRGKLEAFSIYAGSPLKMIGVRK